MNKKISVVVPIYNVEQYLDQCVKSIVNQSYTNLEIILVDDGSQDRCSDICDKWEIKDERIRVIHKINGGLSDARNCGMEIATGDYFSFIDSDDFVDTSMYSKLLNGIQKYNADIAVCGRYMYRDGKCKKRHSVNDIKVFNEDEGIGELLRGVYIDESACGKLYKRELWEGIHFPYGEINEDIITIPHVFEKSKRIVHVSEPLYYYRYNPKSITNGGYNKKDRIVFRHIEYIKKFIKKRHTYLNEECIIFQYRYAVAQMVSILKTLNGKKEYSEDYYKYKNIMLKTYPSVVVSKKATIKQKIKGLMLIFNIWP